MCAKTASEASRADSFWRAKRVLGEKNLTSEASLWREFWRAERAACRQTFGEWSEFGEKKFDERSEPWQCFFFSKLGRIPPQKYPKFLLGGMGNFPPSLPWKNNHKCQRTLYVYPVNNPDIIPQKIFPCGAIAKKKHTQIIYILKTSVHGSIISQKFSPAGQVLKEADIWHLFVCTRAEIFKKFQNLSQTVFWKWKCAWRPNR